MPRAAHPAAPSRPEAVLVTGGAGYIGAVATRAVLDAGRTVVVLDDLSRGHRDAVASGARFVEGRLQDPAALHAALGGPERITEVLHFAAFAYVGESVRQPGLYLRNNVGGTLDLLDACVRAGVERFVLSSSCTVYGRPERSPLDEALPLRPISPYGVSKRQCEEALACFGEAHGLRWAALRYFNAAGAVGDLGERHDPETHLLPNAIRAALGTAPPLTIHGADYPTPDGTCVRDYIHVADLAEAHLRALHALRASDAPIVVNLGSGVGSSIRQVMDEVERATGRAVPHTFGPRRAGDPAALVADTREAQRILGFTPQRSTLRAIIEDAAAFHTRNG